MAETKRSHCRGFVRHLSVAGSESMTGIALWIAQRAPDDAFRAWWSTDPEFARRWFHAAQWFFWVAAAVSALLAVCAVLLALVHGCRRRDEPAEEAGIA